MQWIYDSRAADALRAALPEPVKARIRQVVHGEKRQYPLSEPMAVNIGGFCARFLIKNHSDWARLQTDDIEGDYGRTMMITIAGMDNVVFVDVGSAQGYYSLPAAKAGARVVAIDPDPVSHQSIQRNIEINPDVKDRITVIQAALGAETGEMKLHFDSYGAHAPSLKKTVPGLRQTVQVPVLTLDSLIANGEIPPPDVVKIDVEGAEGEVLKGMSETLLSPNKPKHLFIELHPNHLLLFETTEKEVLEMLESCGYTLQNCLQRGNQRLCHFTPTSC